MEVIKIKNGKITFSDPCYRLGTWCAIYNIPFPNGEYRIQAKKTDEGDWGYRVAEIAIYNKKLVPENESRELDIWWDELEGEVGVDSGQAGIFDSTYYEKFHNENSINDLWYDRICDITLTEEGYGATDELGVVSSSGYGDGGYTAYLGKLGDKIVAAKIVFIDDEEELEDEDWTELEEE